MPPPPKARLYNYKFQTIAKATMVIITMHLKWLLDEKKQLNYMQWLHDNQTGIFFPLKNPLHRKIWIKVWFKIRLGKSYHCFSVSKLIILLTSYGIKR